MPTRKPVVLVAVSMDRASRVALQRAHELATILRGELRVVHVASHRAAAADARPFRVSERTKSHKAAIQDWAAFETGIVLSERRIHLRYGRVPAKVNAVARAVDADLVVVGGRASHSSPAPGKKVEELIQRATRPVMLASPTRDGDVLAATDLEDETIPVVRAAADFARRVGRTVSLVHNVPFGTANLPLALPRELTRQLTLGPLSKLERIVRSASVVEDATVTSRESTAAAVLELARARESDVLVLGAKSRLGRTLREVADGAARSVLVVPEAFSARRRPS
ncbi:MAG: universal stress protein [Myxococcales bacterium]|nr:universal stress protein [Myxococcales bacterium]